MCATRFSIALGLRSQAISDAKPAAGRFPLIALAQGKSGSLDRHFHLAEYLASHGFVTVSTPSGVLINPKFGSSDLVSLLDEAIAYGRSKSFVDGERLGLMAHSLCGVCIILHQDSRKAARAMLSLDGWDGYRSGGKRVRELMTKPIADLGAPFAFLGADMELIARYEEDGPNTFDDRALQREIITANGGMLVHFTNFRHVDFQSPGLLEFWVPNFSFHPEGSGPTLVPARHMIGWQSKYVLRFMQAFVAGDADARASICDGPANMGFDPMIVEHAEMNIDCEGP